MLEKINKLALKNKSSFLPIAAAIIIFVVVIFYLLLTSDSKYYSSDSVVKLYFADNISIAHEANIERFNKKYEGRIEVIPVDLPFEKFSTNERKELLARSLRSKSDKLDIIAIDNIWVSRFARWAKVLNSEIEEKVRENFLPNALDPCIINDDLFAIPLYIDIGVMYYREDILLNKINVETVKQKLGDSITWEEFLKFGKEFENPFYIFSADSYEGLVCSFIELVLNQNREYFENNDIDLTRSESKQALNLLVDLVNRYNITPMNVTSFKENEAFRYFLKEDGIFLRGWPGLDYDIKAIKDSTIKVGKFPLPYFEGTKPAYIIGGWNLMISKYSNHPKEAVIFLKYLISRESQLLMYERANYLPVNKDIYENGETVNKYKDLKYYESLIEKGVHRPSISDYTRVSDIISYYVQKAIKKDITVDQALTDATKMIRENRVLIK